MAPSRAVFHVELRQFPNSTRAFNLTREELDAKILAPWVRGQPVELHERRWSPDRAKLAVYEASSLATEDMGMGRGWANVTRTGEEVTDRVLEDARDAVQSPPSLDALKSQLLVRSAERPLTMMQILDLAGDVRADLSANERIELAGRAIWELLQEGELVLARAARG